MKTIQPEIELANLLTPLDWGVFLFILLLTYLCVLWGNQLKTKQDNKGDYTNWLEILLMGRRLTLPLFTATLVATWYGGIFGVTEIAFNQGIFNFVTQGFFWYVSYIIFALWMVDKIEPFKALTLPDLITKMFGPKSGFLSSIFNFFNVLPIAYIISIGLLLQMLLPVPFWLSMAIGLILILAYSIFGGFRAVVYSDIVQFVVMCSAVALIIIFSMSTFGGIGFLKTKLPDSYFTLTGTNSWASTLVWGFIALSTLVDPNFYQRCFAAKNTQTAKKGILCSTVIWILFDLCTTFGAMYAKAVIPDASSANAYLTYGVQILPPGLRGFLLAGIVATILSTMDSYLFLAGSTLSFDMLPKRFRQNTKLYKWGIIFSGLFTWLLALTFDGKIKTVWKTLGSYSAACLLLPVCLGHLFPGKIKDKQFVFASVLGIIGTSYWRNTDHQGFFANVDDLYAGIFCTLFGLIFYHIFSPNDAKS